MEEYVRDIIIQSSENLKKLQMMVNNTQTSGLSLKVSMGVALATWTLYRP